MAHTNIWKSDGLYRIFTGEVSGDEILISNLELQSDIRFKDIEYVINDFSEITGHSIGVTHTEAYALVDQVISRTKHTLKIALVVPQPSFLDLAKNYCEFMRDQTFECNILQTVAEAQSWIHSKS